MKHNNVIESPHFRKWWQRYVRTWLNQAGRKKSRRIARQKKIAKVAPRPVGMLRPIVHPPTQRYNIKTRFGRGFTLEEIKSAGVSRKAARSIGVAVDHRRQNRSDESLNLNVLRLKTYISKLVMLPRREKAKKGIGGIPNDTLKSEVAAKIPQTVNPNKVMAIAAKVKSIRARKITDEDRKFSAYATLRKARKELKYIGKNKEEEAV